MFSVHQLVIMCQSPVKKKKLNKLLYTVAAIIYIYIAITNI